ncbi:hypothetical protein [Actinomadura madurae]|uniref:hypothetical protein n=1 Tax=Actinomadura madurae TaxID=1993 RepID=UPI0020D24118|nr:hypothetical protein [Actinomadura madurae]MCQ0004111.1 hypothetical protein [Actinomadura madurae]MCQ0020531.1 hypothetical protein [Actinomadura madurae]
MTGTMRVPRSRGAFCGFLLVLLGLWGALLPLAGPYFDFGFAPDDPWVYNTDRLQLSIAPGAATALGGLIVLLSANRAFGMAGAWLAALGGAWFAVGTPVATLWDVPGVGAPLGTEEARHLGEQLAGFTGLGVVVVFLAALALGRFAVAASGSRSRRTRSRCSPARTTRSRSSTAATRGRTRRGTVPRPRGTSPSRATRASTASGSSGACCGRPSWSRSCRARRRSGRRRGR